MITAFTIGPDLYFIEGNTYDVRDTLKEHGARFIKKGQSHWEGSLGAARAIHALVRKWVHVAAHCHEKEGNALATEADVERGFVILGCGWCDKSYRCGDRVPILKVYDGLPPREEKQPCPLPAN